MVAVGEVVVGATVGFSVVALTTVVAPAIGDVSLTATVVDGNEADATAPPDGAH